MMTFGYLLNLKILMEYHSYLENKVIKKSTDKKIKIL